MARSSSRVYDPSTGSWGKSVTVTNEKETTKDIQSSSNKDNLISSTTDSSSSQGKTEKEANYIEYNILEGTLNYIVTEETMKLKAGDTVTLSGIGKYLSGDYYVQDITRSLSSSGYNHSATLIKTDFGATLKTSTKDPTPKKEAVSVSSTVKSKTDTSRTHTLKLGDSLWKLAVDYYKDGSKYTKIAKANNVTEDQFKRLPIGMKVTIP